jgi:hypothetical protein
MLITLAAISACWMHASGSVWWLLINFHSTRIVLFKSTAQTVSGLFEQLHVCHHFIIHFAVTIANHKQIQPKSLLTPSAFLSGLLTMMLITCLCIPELWSSNLQSCKYLSVTLIWYNHFLFSLICNRYLKSWHPCYAQVIIFSIESHDLSFTIHQWPIYL